MRIALVTDGIYPFVTGGMQRHSFLLCKYLSVNHQIDLYHFKQNDVVQSIKELFPETQNNIREFVFSFPDRIKFPFHYLFAQKYYSKVVYDLFRKNEKVDIVICKGFTGWFFLKQKTAGKSDTPILLNFHGLEMFQKAFTVREKIIQFVFKMIVRKHLHQADYCFSYGAGITQLIIDKVGLDSDKIIEFTACVEPSQIIETFPSVPGEKLRFCYVGRFERRKGIMELNQAIAKLTQENNFEFHFIGDIPSDHQLKSPNILYHGKINGISQINTMLDNCDVLFCPSWSEGMPNVILEAMSRGVAVAATRSGAVELLVNSETGWIINGNSPDDIVKTLSEIISTPRAQLYEKKTKSLRHIADNFIWDSKIKELENVLNNISHQKRDIL